MMLQNMTTFLLNAAFGMLTFLLVLRFFNAMDTYFVPKSVGSNDHGTDRLYGQTRT